MRRYLGGRNPIGLRFSAGYPAPDPRNEVTVVGVVDDVRQKSVNVEGSVGIAQSSLVNGDDDLKEFIRSIWTQRADRYSDDRLAAMNSAWRSWAARKASRRCARRKRFTRARTAKKRKGVPRHDLCFYPVNARLENTTCGVCHARARL